MDVAAARPVRDPLIDLLRVSSMAVVVLMHWLTPLIAVHAGGIDVKILPSGPAAWVASWFLQVMPVIFLAGGVANTAVATASRGRYAWYLATRGGRLVLPVAVLVCVVALVSTAAAALGYEQLGRAVSLTAAKPLWFVAVYLVVLALAPAMVAAQRRFGLAVPVALAAAALAVDTLRFAGHESVANLNLVFVWLFAHQLGIAYALGALRAARTRTLAMLALAAAATCVLMATAGPYPPSMIGLSDVPVSNLSPPTGALVVLAVAQFAAITWLGRRLAPALATQRWRRFLDAANAPLMTVYLWHLPAMVLLVGAGLVLPRLLLPDGGVHWWLIRPVWLVNCALILVVLARLMHRFEAIRLPALGTRTGSTAAPRARAGSAAAPRAQAGTVAVPRTLADSMAALSGTGVAAAAICYLWQHGMMLAGAGSAARTAAVLALGCSLVLLACGQPRTGTPRAAVATGTPVERVSRGPLYTVSR